jgi:hypothetical protein
MWECFSFIDRRLEAMSMQSLVGVAVGALGAYVVYRLTCGTKTPKSLKLTYFDIKAAPGEKIRVRRTASNVARALNASLCGRLSKTRVRVPLPQLTLKLAGVPFIDRRVKFPDWPELKKKTKYGQMPFVEADGEEYFQSGSLLRWTGQMGSGALYPASTDPIACRKIEEMMGFAEDLTRAWQPAMYISMRHEGYGHPKEWPAKEEVCRARPHTVPRAVRCRLRVAVHGPHTRCRAPYAAGCASL